MSPRRTPLLAGEATHFVAVSRVPDQVFFGMEQRGLGGRAAVYLFTEMTNGEALDLAQRIIDMVEANMSLRGVMPELDANRPGYMPGRGEPAR